jgi:type VI protein secretion system component VasK
MKNQTARVFWLWARLLVAIFLIICVGAFLLFDFLGLMQLNRSLFLWIAAASLVLVWTGMMIILPWVTGKQEQSFKRTVDRSIP